MQQLGNISHTIANLVTKFALSFPVSYINSISFIKQGNLVATCDWMKEGENSVRINSKQTAFFTQHLHDNVFSDIEVTGVDVSGKPFRFVSPAEQFA
jgi:hypothetical protein